jgi:hypothetical protein
VVAWGVGGGGGGGGVGGRDGCVGGGGGGGGRVVVVGVDWMRVDEQSFSEVFLEVLDISWNRK